MSNRFLLEAKNIIKTFPPTVALNDVHFCLRPGEIHGLMGENGSGKSTMCSIVSGIYPYDSGELFLDGEPYCPKNMIDAAAKGVCMIVQEQGTFASTTVAENIFIGKEKQFHNGIRLDTKKMANAAQKILDELQMQHIDARMTCGRLSFEDRKLVEIARAMYSDPKILIIDETTSALSKNGRDILYGLMEKMKSEGKSVIFISHDIDELMEKCDYLTVFRDGIYIDEVPKEKFNADLIKQLMVGREMVGAYYREDFQPSHEDEVVLSVEHITQGIVTDVSFDAYKGEILGIGGLNECGMHELGKLIFGLEPRTIGVTRYQGGVEFKNPTDAMKLGIGYISKDRDKEAILTAASIRDNICLPSLSKLQKGIFITDKREKEFTNSYINTLEIKTSGMEQLCMHLSGGNKQKVVIAKWVGFDASVLIMDCPTRGIDIGVKAEIYRIMEKMKADGRTIILISEELPELIGMSDRLLIMKDGKITKEFQRSKELSDRDIINYMI